MLFCVPINKGHVRERVRIVDPVECCSRLQVQQCDDKQIVLGIFNRSLPYDIDVMDMADFLDIDSSELALVEGVAPWPGSDVQQLGPPDMDDNYLNGTVLDLQHSTTEGRMLC